MELIVSLPIKYCFHHRKIDVANCFLTMLLLSACTPFMQPKSLCPDCEPLESAVADSDYDQVQHLLPTENNINRPLRNGNTLLHYAAMKPNLKIAELLIESGANLNVKNQNGETPLNTALRYGSESVALLFVESGADVEAVVPNGSSVLSKAAARKNLKLVKLIVEKGANPSRADGRGETPLYLAAESGSEEIFLFLLQAVGPDHDKMVNRVSPLFPAVNRKSYAITEALLKSGYDPNASLDSGITPIFIAAYKGSEDLAKLLAENGAKLNIALQHYGNPAHAAIIGGHPDIAQYFISAGVEPAVITDTLPSTYASAVSYHLYGKLMQHTNTANAKSALSLAIALYKQVEKDGENAINDASSSIWNNRISEIIYYTMLVAIGLDPTLATSSSETLKTRLTVDNMNTQLENKQKHINELIASSKKAIDECQLMMQQVARME